MTTGQLDLLAVLDVGLCNYGQPKPGVPRPCSKPITHRACWSIPTTYVDGTPNSRTGAGGIDCCRSHADYYASAWFPPYPIMSDSTWIEVLTA